MRSLLRLALWLFLLFPQFLPAQTTDSLASVIDSNARAIEQSAKAIQRWKDSLERERVFRNLEENGQSLDAFLQEMRERKEKQKRQWFIRIGLGLLFLIVVTIGLMRRR